MTSAAIVRLELHAQQWQKDFIMATVYQISQNTAIGKDMIFGWCVRDMDSGEHVSFKDLSKESLERVKGLIRNMAEPIAVLLSEATQAIDQCLVDISIEEMLATAAHAQEQVLVNKKKISELQTLVEINHKKEEWATAASILVRVSKKPVFCSWEGGKYHERMLLEFVNKLQVDGDFLQALNAKGETYSQLSLISLEGTTIIPSKLTCYTSPLEWAYDTIRKFW